MSGEWKIGDEAWLSWQREMNAITEKIQAAHAGMLMVPKQLEGEFAVKEADPATTRLLADLTTTTQRASALADECGHLRARFDASEGQLSTAYEGIATLESDLRVARRTIQRLRDQIIKLGARPV